MAYFSDGSATCSITPASAGNISCSSDERLKKNIELFSDLTSLDKILQLSTVTYEWKNLDNGRYTGYLAREIEKLAPEFVKTDDRGYLQVSYTGFIPWITGAIKALYGQIQEQSRNIVSVQDLKADKAEIEQLKSENAALKAKAAREYSEIKARIERIEKILNSN